MRGTHQYSTVHPPKWVKGGRDCNRTLLQGAALREGEREGMRQGKAEFRRLGQFHGATGGGVWNNFLVPASLTMDGVPSTTRTADTVVARNVTDTCTVHERGKKAQGLTLYIIIPDGVLVSYSPRFSHFTPYDIRHPSSINPVG